ncbi:Uncharacterised protein [Klebsiella pneumoniae]|uniref:Uncharacterized protein n=1 Tax=Klebsiella pneumoniae TaxID=573 RepID=A0A377WUC5_KLEPN|nr:Uncharacterised protein [Klebsiella pneumoniae]
MNNPHSSPKSNVSDTASHSGQPAWVITPRAMAHRPMVEPSEISIPPLMITSVSGSATMPMQIKSLVLKSSILRSSMRVFSAPNSRISTISNASSALSQLSFSFI